MNAQLLTDQLWSQVTRLAKTSAHRRAAIAYCTDNKLGLGKGDVLVVDASDGCIMAGSTSAALLTELDAKGVKLYSVPGLHAKVISLGNSAIIGSANMSSNAESASRVEAALITKAPQVVAQVDAFIFSLAKKRFRLTPSEIKRLSKLPVTPRLPGHRGKGRRAKVRSVSGGKVWLTSVHESSGPKRQDQKTDLENSETKAKAKLNDEDATLGWCHFWGNYGIRKHVTPGDSIIEVWRNNRDDDPESVCRYISVVQVDQRPTFTRIWVERSSESADSEISWSQFRRLAKKCELPFTPARTGSRILDPEDAERIFALWPN